MDRIIFDFETTGLYPGKDKVVQIAALKFIGDSKEFLNLYVLPGIPVPKAASDVHGLNDDFLAVSGIPPIEAWNMFSDFIGDELPLIGHNIFKFDIGFLKAAFNEYMLPLPNSGRYYDTAMVYKARKLGERPRTLEHHEAFCNRVGDIKAYGVKFNLSLCMDELGINRTDFAAHSADGDVEMTNLLYLTQVDA